MSEPTTTTVKVEEPVAGEMYTEGRIDVDRHRFPYCIVWTPLPIIRSESHQVVII